MRKLIWLVGVHAALTACSSPVPVTVTELGTRTPQFLPGEATDINDAGRIVGKYGSHAAEFLEDGSVVLLSIPAGSTGCAAVAIADDGTIVGNCTRSVSGSIYKRIYVWDAARVERELRTLPSDAWDEAVDMNQRGVILQSSSGSESGWWTHDLRTGQRTQLPSPPDAQIGAAAINDLGDIVGSSRVRDLMVPVKWSRDALTMTPLAISTGCQGRASGINNHGSIVGFSACSREGSSVPVLWTTATALPIALPPPPPAIGFLTLTGAHRINDAGVVIGRATYFADGADSTKGLAWTADRQIVDLGNGIVPYAINASGVIVGTSRRSMAAKIQF